MLYLRVNKKKYDMINNCDEFKNEEIEDFCLNVINKAMFNAILAYNNISIEFDTKDREQEKVIKFFGNDGRHIRTLKCNSYEGLLKMILDFSITSIYPKTFLFENRQSDGEIVKFNGIFGCSTIVFTGNSK